MDVVTSWFSKSADFVTIVSLIIVLVQFVLTLSKILTNKDEVIGKYVKALLKVYKSVKQGSSDRNKPTSVVGVMLLRRAKSFSIAYILLFAALALQLGLQPANLTVSILILIIAISFFINQQTTEYRIKKGLYGSSENEATEIIEFILAHSKNEDFPNGGAKAEIFPREETKEFLEGLKGLQEG